MGYHSLATAAALRAAGLDVENWVEEADAGVDCRPVGELPQPGGARRVLHYQASTGAPDTTKLLLARSEPLTLCYHNVTPAEFFAPYAPEIANHLAAARLELQAVTERTQVAVADSEYNAQELRGWGVPDVRVSPPFMQPLPPADPDRVRDLRESGRLDLLFVGRVMPNKGHLDLLRALAAIRLTVVPEARLWLVGSAGPEPYMRALADLQARLGLDGGAVTITGPVGEAQLAAHYEAADVYLSLSRHEGFGIPLVEAMAHGLPVVALGAAAVPETLGDAGLVVGSAEPALVAEVVARIGADESLRDGLRSRGRQRARELESYPRAEVILDVLGRAAEIAS